MTLGMLRLTFGNVLSLFVYVLIVLHVHGPYQASNPTYEALLLVLEE